MPSITESIRARLAEVVFRDENIPGSQVSVDKSFPREILHPKSHMLGETEQQAWQIRGRKFTWAVCSETYWVISITYNSIVSLWSYCHEIIS